MRLLVKMKSPDMNSLPRRIPEPRFYGMAAKMKADHPAVNPMIGKDGINTIRFRTADLR
jgi:hypothetical protein